MSTFPSLSGAQLIKALRKLGFDVIRVKGSHHFLRHPDGRSTVVPVHRGEIIGRGLLAQILRERRLRRRLFRRQNSSSLTGSPACDLGCVSITEARLAWRAEPLR